MPKGGEGRRHGEGVKQRCPNHGGVVIAEEHVIGCFFVMIAQGTSGIHSYVASDNNIPYKQFVIAGQTTVDFDLVRATMSQIKENEGQVGVQP